MSDALVQELRAAAEDALARGFFIIPLTPKTKIPLKSHAPSGVKNASHTPLVALKAWNEGIAANYAIACGESNIAVLDADHGISTFEEFEAWRIKNSLPKTFTVRTGRRTDKDGNPEYGVQLYFKGAVHSTKFDLDGVTGEIKSKGGYVVGAGSIHPDSGEKYEILYDEDLAPLPENVAAFVKPKEEKEETITLSAGEKIPAGQRWENLRSMAGRFRNNGLSENGIYYALKDWCEQNCEDGKNYPEDKIRDLAEAAIRQFEASEQLELTIGSPDPIVDTKVPEVEDDVLEGDFIADLCHTLTDGTPLPLPFMRSTMKVVLGAALDGFVGMPGQHDLHMRHWNALISVLPESGKGETWRRISTHVKPFIIDKFGIDLENAGNFSSGEHAIKKLAEHEGRSVLVHFDEMKSLFDKGQNQGSTLFSKLLELFEQKSSGVGSITNGAATFSNVGLNMTGGFTLSGWERSVSGKSAGGDGFLSRMVLCYSAGKDIGKFGWTGGDWADINKNKLNTAIKNLTESIEYVRSKAGVKNGEPFIIEEDDDAREERLKFLTWYSQNKRAAYLEGDESGAHSRIDSHFKRDLVLRAVFSVEKRITKKMVERSIKWAKHELEIRRLLWPIDTGNDVSKNEQRILTAITKQGPMTKSGVQKWSNAAKCSGGVEAWNRAWTALIRADMIVPTGKTDVRKQKWVLPDMLWLKDEKRWIAKL